MKTHTHTLTHTPLQKWATTSLLLERGRMEDRKGMRERKTEMSREEKRWKRMRGTEPREGIRERQRGEGKKSKINQDKDRTERMRRRRMRKETGRDMNTDRQADKQTEREDVFNEKERQETHETQVDIKH